jgi:hypothetical protein
MAESKPFTGIVGEQSTIPFSAHAECDYNPSCAGAVPVPEPGPAMKRNIAQRAQAQQDNEE